MRMTDTSSLWKAQQPHPTLTQEGKPGSESRGHSSSEPGGSEVAGSGVSIRPGAWNSPQSGLQPCATQFRTTQLTQGVAKATGPKPLRWAHRPPPPAGPGVRQGDLQGQLCRRN